MNNPSQRYWLVKQEPAAYSWETFIRDQQTEWTGVRNFQARNNLRAMHQGDYVLFYQSVTNPAVIGVAEVMKEAYSDPTATEGDWVSVVLKPCYALKYPVSLASIKTDSALSNMALIKQSRLSVMPVAEKEFLRIIDLGSALDHSI
ncbi:MAG: EVE domain-containing protein [Chthoniobacterales bacterium]|nr:EVE domain-containing protein [Chthoniobacterales bacterium]